MKPRSSVIKFGGTSVGSTGRMEEVASRVLEKMRTEDLRIAVVVSAMSGETNRILSLMNEIDPQARPTHIDLALAAGEQVSCALVAAALEKRGIASRGFLGFQLGIQTDQYHTRAKVLQINTQPIEECWRNGMVPVIAGFQGISEDLQITTLGRGGSDTTAVALAAALKADRCEIYTDVDGMFSADPRLVPQARFLDTLSYDVALEMAALGSKVLHSRCVELGAKFNVPIWVRNSFKPEQSRFTKIMSYSSDQVIESPVVSGISVEKNILSYQLKSCSPEAVARVFEVLGEHGVNVDVIIYHAEHEGGALSFTCGFNDQAQAARALQDPKLKGIQGRDTPAFKEVSKISVVGLGMQHSHGVAGRVFTALKAEDIPVLMISTSEIKISCVIPTPCVEGAVTKLHHLFVESSL